MIIVIQKLISIFVISLIGFVANKKDILPNQSSRYLVDLLMMITTPCLLLSSITSTELTDDTVKSTILMLICSVVWFVTSAFLAWILCIKIFKMKDNPDAGVYLLSITTINNGFMGFPITLALFGEEVFFYMVIFQIMLVIYLYSGGIMQVDYGHMGKMDLKFAIKQLINPCSISAVLAIIMLFMGLKIPDILFDTVDSVGSITVPLSLLVIGIQLGSSEISTVIRNRNLVLTSIVKMIAWPVITFLVVNWLPLPLAMKLALIFGSVFPASFSVVAVTGIENRNTVLAAEMIAFTTLLSVITIPVSAILLMGYYGLM